MSAEGRALGRATLAPPPPRALPRGARKSGAPTTGLRATALPPARQGRARKSAAPRTGPRATGAALRPARQGRAWKSVAPRNGPRAPGSTRLFARYSARPSRAAARLGAALHGAALHGGALHGAVPLGVVTLGLALLGAVLLAPARTSAQEAVPPAVVDAPPPAYPEGATGDATVDLLLTIEDDGTVSAVEVAAGEPPFAERAAAAAAAYRFTPARVDGTPRRARIRFRVAFTAPALAPGRDAAAVADAGPDAEADPDLEAAAAEADAGAEAGAEAGGDAAAEAEPELKYGARATAEAPRVDAARHTLEAEELGRLAGTRGDPLRGLELLPGVGRPPLLSGGLILRGSAPRDSAVFIDGVEVPLLYHFGGLTSVVPAAFLERIELVPGGFSVRYGRRTGGIAEVGTRAPREGLHGAGELTVIDVNARLEGGRPGLVGAVAARRSLVDVFFRSLIPTDLGGDVAAPAYWDYQAMLDWAPSPTDDLRVRVYGAHDALRSSIADPGGDDPAIRGDFGGSQQFHVAQLRWIHRGPIRRDLSFAVVPDVQDVGIGDAGLRLRQTHFRLRAEWQASPTEAVRLRAGLDADLTVFDVLFNGPRPRQVEGTGRQPTLASEELVRLDRRGTTFRPAAYLESRMTPFDVATLQLGLRVDHFSEIDAFTLDPRALLLVRPAEGWVLTASAGLFSQPPELAESEPTLGNPDLEPLRAAHYALGAEGRVGGARFGAQGFVKRLWDLPVSTRGGAPPVFESAGTGRVRGLELFANVDRGPLRMRASYTFARSRRRDRPAAPRRVFDFDQPHVLALTAMFRLPRGWTLGATFRYVSGNPDTPVAGAVYDAASGTYLPLNGEPNALRAEAFRRLDLRAEKVWTFAGGGRLRLFLDVLNVTNADNPEGRRYDYDYTDSVPVRGLPILPSLGLRGER
ncbi:MAG: hypothetical protein CMN31_18570 [Sandaracinus sp.]|nr:hypothetical protein [Sandaracinus sp.]